MILGGTNVFEQFLPKANRIYLTIIDQDFEGDTYFPEFDETIWKVTSQEEHQPDEKNKYPYTFVTYEKR